MSIAEMQREIETATDIDALLDAMLRHTEWAMMMIEWKRI